MAIEKNSKSPVDEVVDMSLFSEESQKRLRKIAGEMESVLGYDGAKQLIRTLYQMDTNKLMDLLREKFAS